MWRLQVNYFIHHLDQKATLKPKGYEGVTDPAKAAAAAEAKAQKEAAAKAAAKAKREAAAAPLPKPAGRVAVVGAGPAGLAAAVLLQVTGSTARHQPHGTQPSVKRSRSNASTRLSVVLMLHLSCCMQ